MASFRLSDSKPSRIREAAAGGLIEALGTDRRTQCGPQAEAAQPRVRFSDPGDVSRRFVRLETCIVTRYTSTVIKSFRHKGVEHFFLKGTKAGIQSAHAAKLARQLQRLDVARRSQDMNVPGWKLRPLQGDLEGHWAVWVSGNWRLTFRFENDDVILVDYQDYH